MRGAFDWGGYVKAFHASRPGSTESVLSRTLSGGHTSYRWLARAVSPRARIVLDLACGSGAMARELSRPLKLFVASQPTRGVDVGSIEFIHKRIVAERDKGVPVIIVSTELDEVYALADRIAVFFHGKLMGIVPPDTPRETLGRMMAGETADEVLPPAPWDDSQDQHQHEGTHTA